jgi:nucleoside-diphosphate-sugar epimerase
MIKTLVTGATGFIGSHVAKLLVCRGDNVHVAVREGSSERSLAGLPVTTIHADVLDRRAVRRAMRGVERVFHLAGTTSLTMPRERVFALNVEGTRIVLEEALRAGVERLVYTSSVAAVRPAPQGEVADESNLWDAGRLGLGYVDSKHEAEATAMRLLARGLPLVIVNPADVLGPGDPGRSSLPLSLAIGLSGIRHRAGLPGPAPAEIKTASLNWAFSNRKAKRELGWRTARHEDSLEATVAWYREFDGNKLVPARTRQPYPLRASAVALRRLGIGR